MTLKTPDNLKHQLLKELANASFPDLADFLPPPRTAEVKNLSEKRSMEPAKTTLALFLE